MKKKDSADNCQSSISLCQPSCGYYFSSGYVISETVYSSSSHGAFYNAASRIVIDGGRKVLHTAALGGMLAQNFTFPVYAGDSSGVTVSAGETATVSAGEKWSFTMLGYEIGDSAVLNVFGSTYKTDIARSGFEYVYNGGIAEEAQLWISATQYVSSGGRTISTGLLGSGAKQYVLKISHF